MRVLAATTAGAGHFAGLLPFVRACQEVGHDVRVAAPASFAGTVTGAGLSHVPLPDIDGAALGQVLSQIPSLQMREADALIVQEVFGRLDAEAALPAMRELMDSWRPDVLLREPAELASYVSAQERGIPHVQTNTGLNSLDDFLLPLLDAPLAALGGDPAGLRTAPRWTVVPPGFDQDGDLVLGPVLRGRDTTGANASSAPLPPWWEDSDDPLVYVTFGSVAAGIGFFPAVYVAALEQLRDLPVRVLLTLGAAGDPAALGALPPNVHVERWWPQADVLAQAAVVVGHGGFGTTQAALAAAVPQVVVPLFSFDQFINAERVASVGNGMALIDAEAADRLVGETVPHGPRALGDLGVAVRQVLQDETYRTRAGALASEVSALPTTAECVASLEAML